MTEHRVQDGDAIPRDEFERLRGAREQPATAVFEDEDGNRIDRSELTPDDFAPVHRAEPAQQHPSRAFS
jgi:hypothetical protein